MLERFDVVKVSASEQYIICIDYCYGDMMNNLFGEETIVILGLNETLIL